jgi:hypothetical protein
VLVVIRDAGHVIPNLEFTLRGESWGWNYRRWSSARARDVLGLTMPMVLDTPEATVEEAYAAWPARMLIINEAGEIARDAGLIIQGWDLTALERWLQQHGYHAESRSADPTITPQGDR